MRYLALFLFLLAGCSTEASTPTPDRCLAPGTYAVVIYGPTDVRHKDVVVGEDGQIPGLKGLDQLLPFECHDEDAHAGYCQMARRRVCTNSAVMQVVLNAHATPPEKPAAYGATGVVEYEMASGDTQVYSVQLMKQP